MAGGFRGGGLKHWISIDFHLILIPICYDGAVNGRSVVADYFIV